MQISVGRLPSATFLFAGFCFLLPFMTVSCPGGHYTFSGLQLATGTTVAEAQMFGAPTQRNVDPDFTAFGALALTLAAFAVGLKQTRRARRASAVCGALAVVLLLLLKGRADLQMTSQGHGLFTVTYGIGFWLAVLSLTAAAALAVAITTEERSPSPAALPERALP